MLRPLVAVTLTGLASAGAGCSRGDARPVEAPRRVHVAQAERRSIPRMVVAVGTLLAEESAELGFKVPGRLLRWDVDLGSRVAAGAALAQQQLEDTRLVAPFAGAVQQRRASLGEYLAAGAPVLTVMKLTPLRLRVEVPEREAPNIRRDQEAAVRVEGSTAAWPGRIVRLSPALDETTRSLIVEAEVDNSKGLLRPGSFARAEIRTESGGDSLVVPGAAVVMFAGIEKVVTVKDGKAHERPVTTGRRAGEVVEILSGLEDGEMVVVKPGNLATGVAVEVAPGAAPGA